MKTNSVFLYYAAAGWTALGAVLVLYFLLQSMEPTADVKAKYQNRIRSVLVENWEPGDVKTLMFDDKPVVLWRRSLAEMATAMAQIEPSIPEKDWFAALNDGSLKYDLGPEKFSRLEWLVISPINAGGYGCIVRTKAGDYGGFFDACQTVHFDLWGRPRKGPTNENLRVAPAQVAEDQRSIYIDVSDLPSTR